MCLTDKKKLLSLAEHHIIVSTQNEARPPRGSSPAVWHMFSALTENRHIRNSTLDPPKPFLSLNLFKHLSEMTRTFYKSNFQSLPYISLIFFFKEGQYVDFKSKKSFTLSFIIYVLHFSFYLSSTRTQNLIVHHVCATARRDKKKITKEGFWCRKGK